MANTAIYQNLLRAPKSVADYDAEAMQADYKKAVMREHRQNALMLGQKNAEYTRGLAEDEVLRKAVSTLPPGATTQQMAAALRSTGLQKGFVTAESLLTKDADAAHKTAQGVKDRSAAAKADEEAGKSRDDRHLRGVQLINEPQDVVTWIDAVKKGGLFPSLSGQFDQLKTMVESDPSKAMAVLPQIKRQLSMLGVAQETEFTEGQKGQRSAAEIQGRADVGKANNAQSDLNNRRSVGVQERGQTLLSARAAESNAIARSAQSAPMEFTDLATGKPVLVTRDKAGNLTPVKDYGPKAGRGADEKPLSQDQGKATAWLDRMNQSEAVILASPKAAMTSTGSPGGMVGATIGSVPILGESGLGKMARNVAESPERQAVRTAQEAWVQGLLRSDTGAAYKDMEKNDIIRAFFPQPGEAASQTAIKAGLRDGVRRSMQVRAGPGPGRMEKVPKAAGGASSAVDDALKLYGGKP